MEITLMEQVTIFIGCALGGAAISILYDVFRIARKIVKSNFIITFLEDTIFWLITSMFLFALIFRLNRGDIRFYQFLGVFFGVVVYMTLFSPLVVGLCMFIYNVIKAIVLFILKILFFPVRVIAKLLRVPVFFTVGLTRRGIKRAGRRAKNAGGRLAASIRHSLKFVRKV